MGDKFPITPAQGGDDEAVAPRTSSRSLLGTQRGTDETRRIETDDENNVYVHVAKDSSGAGIGSNPLAVGTASNVAANSQQTIITYTVPLSITGISRISCSGTTYAKFQLYKNTTLIETLRSGPNRNISFGAFDVATNDIIDVKVTHYATSVLANFESTIYGV